MDAERQYDDLNDRVLFLYRGGRQREALELLDSASPSLDPWSAELAHLRACMHGSMGEVDLALQVLVQASMAGAWWHEDILTEDDDLAGLQQLPDFRQIVEVSRGRRVNDRSSWLVKVPADGVPPSAVVVALHGAGQTAARAARDWAAVLELGYALVCVESSQLIAPRSRTWPDRAQAATDIAAALADLPAELLELPLVAGGFSDGGRAALDWALSAQPLPVEGSVVLAPALRELPVTGYGPLSPATVLIGVDDHLLKTVEEAADRLSELGLSVRRIPGLGHRFPDNFADHLRQIFGA